MQLQLFDFDFWFFPRKFGNSVLLFGLTTVGDGADWAFGLFGAADGGSQVHQSLGVGGRILRVLISFGGLPESF